MDHISYRHTVSFTEFSFSRDSSCSYSVVMPGFDWHEHWIKRLEMCRLEAICSLYRPVNSIYPFIQVACFPIPLLLSLSCMPMQNGFLARYQRAAACLVAATAIFRCDILLLLFTVGLSWLIRGDLTVSKAIQVGVLTGVICLTVTIPLDSLMWQTWTWPEGQVFYYNAILGKSSDWGTSPWHWYVSTAIPKAMLATLLLVPLAFLRIPSCRLDTTWLAYFVPIAGFILLYSCLGHKEMRFMFPAMPILNLAAAVGMTKLQQWAFPPKNKSSSLLAKLSFLGGIGCILSTLLASLIFLQVSKHNYPGGQALELATAYLQEKMPRHEYGLMWHRACLACPCLVNEMQCIVLAFRYGTREAMKRKIQLEILRDIHTCFPRIKTCLDFMLWTWQGDIHE